MRIGKRLTAGGKVASGECLIRTTTLVSAYLLGSGLVKSLSTPSFYAIGEAIDADACFG
jgi:hypothetical protein